MADAIARPARTSQSPEGDALDRVEQFFGALDHLAAADFAGVSLAEPGPDVVEARRAALHAADGAGLADLVDDARERAAERVTRSYAGAMLQPTMFGLNWARSSGRIEDRVAVQSAVEDAAIAAVVDGLVSDRVTDVLRERLGLITSLHPAGDTPVADPRRRSTRWIVGAIVVVLVLSFGLYALQFDALAVAIPIVMIVTILIIAARQEADR